jgi:hypothetical protein
MSLPASPVSRPPSPMDVDNDQQPGHPLPFIDNNQDTHPPVPDDGPLP